LPIQVADNDRLTSYRTVAADLRAAIRKGTLAAGARIPTEVELATRYGLSRQTIRRALDDLVSDGLVSRVRGHGTFVRRRQQLRSTGTIEDLLALSPNTVVDVVEPLERHIDPQAAGRLRLDSDEVMVTLLRFALEDVPFGVSTVTVPLALGLAIAGHGALEPQRASGAGHVVDLIGEVWRDPICAARQSVTVGRAGERLAALIDEGAREPLLRIDRLYLGASGASLALAVSYFNPRRYSYRLELRRVHPDMHA
jgi:GntR family transcriptional regulator